jgi:hypothetical protein
MSRWVEKDGQNNITEVIIGDPRRLYTIGAGFPPGRIPSGSYSLVVRFLFSRHFAGRTLVIMSITILCNEIEKQYFFIFDREIMF